MNKLTCELCGSSDFVKQDGMLVCQGCGTKYTLEEARKVMSGGAAAEPRSDCAASRKVNVSGSTVKVDTSDELSNLYLLARRARDGGSSEDAVRYYDMILFRAPNDWEATFYTTYYNAMMSSTAEVKSTSARVSSCISIVLSQIHDHITGKDEQLSAIGEILSRCSYLAQLLCSGALEYYNGLDPRIRNEYLNHMLDAFDAAADIMCLLGDGIEALFGSYDEGRAYAVAAWKQGVEHSAAHASKYYTAANNKRIEKYTAKIQNYEQNYSTPKEQTGGCYVATAVYGSYDCPQVWTLRRFRDNTLAETWYGRVFIRIYYAISPTLVRWFGHTGWFKRLWREPLDRMVAGLNAQGVKDTPYQDKAW